MTAPERNEPCPCGSGKKYKQCCMRTERAPVAGGPGRLGEVLAHIQLGRMQQAEALCHQILQTEPHQPDALHWLGVVAGQTGRLEAAGELINRAIAIKPGEPAYYHSMGLVLMGQGRLDEAIAGYQKALALRPEFVEAWYNLGIALRDRGELDRAAESFRRAGVLRPGFAEAYYNLGKVLQSQGKLDEAIASYRKALLAGMNSAEVHGRMGGAFQVQGKLDEAIASYHRALAIKPDYPEVCNNLGNVFQLKHRGHDAIASYRRAISIRPDYFEAYNNLANALKEKNQLEAAIDAYRHALMLRPDSAGVYGNLGNALKDQGKPEEAIAAYRRSLSLNPDNAEVHTNLLLSMQYVSSYSPAETFAEHLHFGEQFEAPLKPYWSAHANTREPERRLKIGYVSGDFCTHSVAFFMEPILSRHDKSAVEVYCYYNNNTHDHITDRIMATADHWLPCTGLTDEQLAARIREDGIDILVDLSGHTRDNRLLVFARKPAPIQITWIGYPGTTGLRAMDYLLTDKFRNPPGMTEQYYTETLLRLPSSSTFQPAPESPPVNRLPALEAEGVTFACLNNVAKISEEAVSLWSRILKVVPQSRLMLGNVVDAGLRQKLEEMFGKNGIGAERLVLHPRMSLAEYLALHHQIDLAFDPFPYNGGTTTSHSLWMGVPVITLAGEKAASRIGSTLLRRFGLDEFVTGSEGEYYERTLEIVGDLPGLERIRQGLRERMLSNASADPAHLTRSLEETYRSVWRKWCAA